MTATIQAITIRSSFVRRRATTPVSRMYVVLSICKIHTSNSYQVLLDFLAPINCLGLRHESVQACDLQFVCKFLPEIAFSIELVEAGVVIHRVYRNGSDFYSTLITDRGNFYALTEGTEWTRYLEVNDDGSLQLIRVRVLRIDARKHSANIHISTTFDPVGH